MTLNVIPSQDIIDKVNKIIIGTDIEVTTDVLKLRKNVVAKNNNIKPKIELCITISSLFAVLVDSSLVMIMP